MSAYDDWARYQEEDALEAFFERELRNLSEGGVRNYLGTYGDAIEERVNTCLRQAEELSRLGYHGPSLVLSATAAEITIRFLLLNPLLQGAFLSDEWSEILTGRVAKGRSAEDRALLPAVLRLWGLDITQVKLSDGTGLWGSALKVFWSKQSKRNAFVHCAEPVTEGQAALGMECTRVLLGQVVRSIAAKLGFTLETTGKWHKLRGAIGMTFEAKNPFQGSAT